MPSELAVAPSILTPGLYLVVNLVAGVPNPGIGTLRILIVAPKNSTGNLTVDAEIRTGTGAAGAATAWGTGSLGHLIAKQIYNKYPAAQVDFAAPTAGAGQATLNVTASGVPVIGTSIELNIAGRVFEVVWNAAETAATWATRAIAEVNSRTDDLPVVAASGGAGILTLNAKGTGRWGNDTKIRARLTATQNGTEAVDTGTVTPLAGGTTDPDMTTIAGLAIGQEYHYIVLGLSNVDAVLATTSSNAYRVKTIVAANNTGLNAKLQQIIYWSTTTLAAAKAAAIFRNSQFTQHGVTENAMSLPGERAGREAGGRLATVVLDPSGNRIGELVDGIYGSIDPIADRPTLAESEDMIGNGVTLDSYDPVGRLYLVRPITTYSIDSVGGVDRRLLDIQNVDATYIIARDLRGTLPLEFAQAKVMRDVPPGEEPPPVGVTEERDIKGFVISRMRFWQARGQVQGAQLDASILDGTLSVNVDDTDPTQVNIFVPMKIIQPLAKMGVVVDRLTG